MDQISLARQVNLALERLTGELTGMSAGTIVLQIRNDEVGKFGIRHLPVECGTVEKENVGLTVEQAVQLRKLAVDALRHKRGWTHGEIAFDFALRQGKMNVSVQFESNYIQARSYAV